MDRVRIQFQSAVAAIAAIAAATPASAVIVTGSVNFVSSTNMTEYGSDNELASNRFVITQSSATAPALTVSAQGWNGTANTSGGYTLSREYVGQYVGGIGVTTAANDYNGAYGLHQADNIGTTAGSRSIDFLLLTFNWSVNLTALSRNSYGTPSGANYATVYDNDFSYGNLAAAPSETASWTLPTSIYNPINASACGGSDGSSSSNCLGQSQSLSSTAATSRYWLVSASFLTNYGGNGQVDAFKLASVDVKWDYTAPATTPNNSPVVPEPATWAQMILGFGLAGAALRRRRTMTAAA